MFVYFKYASRRSIRIRLHFFPIYKQILTNNGIEKDKNKNNTCMYQRLPLKLSVYFRYLKKVLKKHLHIKLIWSFFLLE